MHDAVAQGGLSYMYSVLVHKRRIWCTVGPQKRQLMCFLHNVLYRTRRVHILCCFCSVSSGCHGRSSHFSPVMVVWILQAEGDECCLCLSTTFSRGYARARADLTLFLDTIRNGIEPCIPQSTEERREDETKKEENKGRAGWNAALR